MKRKEIENILKDYHWMLNSIKIMRKSLDDVSEGLTSQYGLEASMPKAQGVSGDPVFREYIRREKRFKRIHEYEQKIKAIQNRMYLIENEREIEVLHWLLEGKSYRWIARHMGLSFSHIRRIRGRIIDKMSDDTKDTKGTKGTNDTKGTNYQKEKDVC